ncbi:hypothetical protein ASG40_12990 [Methylobacterium sp. Leaf399]|uniref:hypothetical protein n=1 Tax=unclassified Methylobacterium TaxID=2615210 RepID=UPI0006F2E051|nr:MULTISPECIES: hypothetical protein [unclassified Methylobacterium]KQP50836.1 hypothetical protein ASF39_11370 [Methylobacterium sp. Leaf108]KQT07817.1 hypothetical protein ASG40_12990 [Methylobacterium sp. Leaf399]KQT88932.1 hypothetical protein ASG59_13760 [Methylobacterium sp. Leaf466]
MAALVKLAPFAPDVASVDASVSSVATNVTPRADGYGPVLSPLPISLPLPADCRGGVQVNSPAFGFPIYFAATQTKLYKFNGGTSGWDDVSKPGTVYSVPPGDYWSFALYGSRLVAVCLGTRAQAIDVDSGRVFADLGGMPPRARHCGVVGEFLVLAGLASDPNAVQWSDLGNIDSWPLGLSNGREGDIQPFPDGGAVTGFAGGEFGIVFQERTIRRMVFVPGSAEVFDFDVYEENRGAVAPWSLAKVGAKVFFLDRDGFYVFAGGGSTAIGAERVNRFFAERVDPNAVASVVAIRDVTGPRVMFAYRSRSAPTTDRTLLDEVLLYDWLLDRWSFLKLPIRFGLVAATPATSIDSIPGSLDDPGQISLDDPSYAGGAPAFGLVTADNRLALLKGPALEAILETPDAMIARPDRAFVRGLRLDTDADDWRVAIGVRETLRAADPVRFKPETAPTVERFAPCRASARYHRVRARIPAGTAWSYVTGVEPDATPEGRR